ncbi:hypothetical protein [Virgibacillus doumboii]|uniref:hypothetical protein n=1 Tax=Virgibacillus doumboii TaxID=2697503 RepID=UPI0013E086E9|nr:hypothetical protein [Virgibacillus doumboii]
MAKNKIVVQRGKEKRVVQPSMVPEGFRYVEDYKEPKKASSKQKNAPKKESSKTKSKSKDKK